MVSSRFTAGNLLLSLRLASATSALTLPVRNVTTSDGVASCSVFQITATPFAVPMICPTSFIAVAVEGMRSRSSYFIPEWR
jgi:hypothetical protein